MVKLPTYLDIRENEIDLIICEVKSSRPAFNKAIRDETNLADVLQWAGVLSGDKISSIVPRLVSLLKDDADRNAIREGILEGNVRVRALLCCPPVLKDDPKLWCLTGEEIFRFIHLCFDTSNAPPTCARRYAYELWGEPYGQIVRWFKETKQDERTLAALCAHMLKR